MKLYAGIDLARQEPGAEGGAAVVDGADPGGAGAASGRGDRGGVDLQLALLVDGGLMEAGSEVVDPERYIHFEAPGFGRLQKK